MSEWLISRLANAVSSSAIVFNRGSAVWIRRLDFCQTRDVASNLRVSRDRLQLQVVVADLAVECLALFSQKRDGGFTSRLNLRNGVGQHHRIAADGLELLDHESFDLTSGHGRRRAFRPTFLHRRSADVVAVPLVALAAEGVRHRPAAGLATH